MDGVSVVVCCYNSAEKLSDTLFHLSRQKISSSIPWEVIIVDNNSTDSTGIIARDTWNRFNKDVPMIICKETAPGLSYARIKGVSSANYECIIFCDDDNWLGSSYLEEAFHLMNNDRNIGALGGWSEPVFEKGQLVPQWFESVKNSYAVGLQSNESGDITKRGYIWGAGLVIRKSLFKKITNSDYPLFLSDRKGIDLASGGDAELCLRVIILGYRLHYDTKLFYQHFIPASRLTEVYREKLFVGLNNSMEKIEKYFFFIENYLNNNRKLLSKIKWYLIYCMVNLKLKKFELTSFYFRMLTLYIGYTGPNFDKDLNALLLFHKSKF